MKEISDNEYEVYQKLLKILVHAKPEISGAYFVCGEGGEKDDLGLPETVLICPQHGLNIVAVYEKKIVSRSGQ